jgi:predicted glycosyltransferase
MTGAPPRTRETSRSGGTRRVLMYSQDGFGLGHLRRTSSIAAELVRQHPDVAVLSVGDSRLGEFFAPTPNHEFVKLPSIVKITQGHWRPVALPLPFEDVSAVRRDLLRSIAASYRPDLFLVDHMPHGAVGELLPTLEVLRAQGACVVLGLRDVLDAPAVIRERWGAEGAYQAMDDFYDRILVYGQRDVFDLAREYGFSPASRRRVACTGYVCTGERSRYGHRLRGELLGSERDRRSLVVAMAGGGADAYPLMSAVVDAVPAVHAQHPCLIVLIAGPFMPVEQRREIQARARGLPIRVRVTVSDALSYLEAADLVIAMAGYNTTMEILRSGVGSILVPRRGPSAEQRIRAHLFAQRGWIHTIDPDELDAELLAKRIISQLDRPPATLDPDAAPNLDGLARATSELGALLDGGRGTVRRPVRVPAGTRAARGDDR